MHGLIRKFNVETYSPVKKYDRFDIVKIVSRSVESYYVSVSDSNLGNFSLESNDHWKRFDAESFDFADIWTPTYNTQASVSQILSDSRIDDGAFMASRFGINNNRLTFNLVFEGISNKEAKSLMCFFDYFGTTRTFYWSTPPPFEKRLKFCCVTYSNKYNQWNNNSLSLTVEQSFAIFGTGAAQESSMNPDEENTTNVSFGWDDLSTYPLGEVHTLDGNSDF